MNTYIVIPAYNEQTRLPQLVKAVLDYIPPNRIVIVDDGSHPPLKPLSGVWRLRHDINLGKGAAMRTGADFAFSQGAHSVLFMDADLQHDPHDIPQFLDSLKQGLDLVFGSRLHNLDTPMVRYLGNKFASLYIRFIFGAYVSDILSGYRALTKKAYRLLKWESNRYGVETEMVARLGLVKSKLRWIELPTSSIYIDKYKGVTLVSAIRILSETLWWRLSWTISRK